MLNESVPSRLRVADNVYSILKRAIVRHELPPGARLSAPALASELGVSRSPVREAVQRLIQEGLATEEPHRGAVVTSYQADELLPLYEVRSSLEGLAARLTSAQADRGSLDRVSQILHADEQAVAEDDMERHLQADIDFHSEILASCQNPVLQGILQDIYGKIQMAMFARVVPTGPQRALNDHRAILEAILAGEPDRAEKAARRHVRRIQRRLATQAAPSGDGVQA